MKNLFYILLMASLIGLSASGCSKDDDAANPTHKVPDPEGTVELNMRNYDNGCTSLLFIYVDEGNNFYCRNSFWHVIDLGEMKGLGNITQYTSPVPSNLRAAAIPGHGYLFHYDNHHPEFEKWMRLYVDSYIVNILDEIIGVRVKYQEPFLPANPQAINNQVAEVVAQE